LITDKKLHTLIMVIHKNSTIGELSIYNAEIAGYFREKGIDFRFEGELKLKELAENADLEIEGLLYYLNNLVPAKEFTNFERWPLDLVLDYISKKHHRYVLKSQPVIGFYLNKVCNVHGERHPELFEIRELFLASTKSLIELQAEEANLLYPAIGKLFWAKENDRRPELKTSLENLQVQMESIRKTFKAKRDDHLKIQYLSNDYTNPPDGCTSYRIGLEKLKEFRDQLFEEAHLKNNLLFPKTGLLINYFSTHYSII